MILVDTNVLAYLLIEGDHTEHARELYRRDPDWRSEAFLLVEFGNVLLRYMELRRMKLAAAQTLLASAEAVLDGKLARVPHGRCLEIAAKYRVTAYDARFLALADQLHIRLVTEDKKLRKAAAALTQSLVDALV